MDSQSIIKAARHKVGAPFWHHFKPKDKCHGGLKTVDDCMRFGVGPDGYDCSGLIIACYSEVLGRKPDKWNPGLRHVLQMEKLVKNVAATPGDVLVFYPVPIPGKSNRPHIGIYVSSSVVIHASGRSKQVEEGSVEGEFRKIRAIPVFTLIQKGPYSASNESWR